MAAKEMYDFLSTATPDSTATLALDAQGKISEEGFKNQVIHMADDNSEERITLSTGSIFYVNLAWNALTESDAGEIMDLYHNATRTNGMGDSFYYTGHDRHTYVTRFDSILTREGPAVDQWGYRGVRLRVLGRLPD